MTCRKKVLDKVIRYSVFNYSYTLRSKRVDVTNLCESFSCTHIASQLGSDWWVKELIIKFVWVQMTILVSNFSQITPWVCETQICESSQSTFNQGDYQTDTPRRIDGDLMSILRRCIEKKISINFQVISTYFFDVISMGEKSMVFRRTLLDVISMRETSTSFRWTIFDLISMDEKSTLLLCTIWCILDIKLM